jgi:hypothetical protein
LARSCVGPRLFLISPGGRFAYHFHRHFAAVVDLRALTGLNVLATLT